MGMSTIFSDTFKALLKEAPFYNEDSYIKTRKTWDTI